MKEAKSDNTIYVDPMLESLIPKFLVFQKNQFELVKNAFQNRNYEELKALGHQMKGSCGSYGFQTLGDFGKKIEHFSELQDLKRLEENISQLEKYLHHLKIEYR
ncbi:MAG: Hpt domain-containing protein [Bdellovibrionales bacterium]